MLPTNERTKPAVAGLRPAARAGGRRTVAGARALERAQCLKSSARSLSWASRASGFAAALGHDANLFSAARDGSEYPECACGGQCRFARENPDEETKKKVEDQPPACGGGADCCGMPRPSGARPKGEGPIQRIQR